MKFEKLFTENQDGSLTPIKIIQIGGVTFGPGVSIGPGVLFGGIDFFKIKGKDIATVHGTGGTVVIKGYYQTNR